MDHPSPMTEASPAAASTASTHQRRAHRKSRNGCSECRRRKVKCSEGRPRCLACIRHDVPCRYPARPFAPGGGHPGDSSVTATLVDGAESAASNPNPASNSHVQGRREGVLPTWFSVDDMALLHHWTLSTSRTIANSPDVDHCWHSIFPQIGFREPFVLHAIVSLAALHLAYSNPTKRDDYIIDATRHHNTALQGFRDMIDRMVKGDHADGDAIVAFSTLNIVYVFGVLGCLQRTPERDMKSRAARVLGNDWIPMIRGVGPVVATVWDRVHLGPLAQLLRLDNWDRLDPDHDLNAAGYPFRSVHEAWAGNRDDGPIYDKAWYAIRKCFLFSRQFSMSDDESQEDWGYNRQCAGPIMFLYSAPEEYFTRLHQRQPQALVIFSYFAAMLHSLDGYWFFEGWGRDIVEVIDQLLGDFWRPWTEWPRDVVKLDTAGV